MGAHILSISYDLTLLQTRQLLLETEGYLVTSTLRFEEAVERCRDERFDLVIIGHSIPEADKQEFIKNLRRVSSAPILGLVQHGEGHVAGAKYDLEISVGPRKFVATVRSIVGRRAKAA